MNIYTLLILCLTMIYHFDNLPFVRTAIAPLPLDYFNPETLYRSHPNEVLSIEPLLVYPKARDVSFRGRKYDKEDPVIYVKLIDPKRYKPIEKHRNNEDILISEIDYTLPIRDGENSYISYKKIPKNKLKDVVYVKALANGMFSRQKVKVYKLPEFYAIKIFHQKQQQEK